jgi:hypothetical protein
VLSSISQVLTPVAIAEWQEILQSDDSASASQSPEWLRAVCDNGPFVDVSRLYRTRDGRRLVLPLVRRKGMPGDVAIRMSFPVGWDCGGIIAEGGVLTQSDVCEVAADLGLSSGASTVVSPNPGQDALWRTAASSWSIRRTFLAHVLDLRPGFGRIWTQCFKSSVRRAVRKAEASSLTVERGAGSGLMPEFYELYEQSVLRWAKQDGIPSRLARWRSARLDSLRKFERVTELLGPACVTWLARLEGRAVAGIVVLEQGAVANYWRGAMSHLAGPVRANDLLHRLAIEDACVRGMRRYSLGDSRPGSGVARFKEAFGAQPQQHSEYLNERLPLFRSADAARGVMQRALTARVHKVDLSSR